MFDPHHTRTFHRRKYQKKGQIIQARKVDIPRTIEHSLIPIYRDYFIKNYISTYIPPSEYTFPPFYIQSPEVKLNSIDGQLGVVGGTSCFYIELSDDQTELKITLYFFPMNPKATKFVPVHGFYINPSPDPITLYTQDGTEIITIQSQELKATQLTYPPNLTIPYQPGLILNDLNDP